MGASGSLHDPAVIWAGTEAGTLALLEAFVRQPNRRTLLSTGLLSIAGAAGLPSLSAAVESAGTPYNRPKLKITEIRTAEVRVHGYQVHVRVYTDQGIIGQGETTDASAGNVPLIRLFSRFLIGQDPLNIEAAFERIRMAGVFAGAQAMSGSNPENRIRFSRRQALLFPATAGIGAAVAATAEAADSIKTAAHQAPGYCSTPRSAVANTQYGKVRGFLDGGVFTFKGIPYGQDTSGENRWLPAKTPKPWEGEYPALIYGANCPQRLHDYTAIEQSFIQDWDDGYPERGHAQAERLDARPDGQTITPHIWEPAQ